MTSIDKIRLLIGDQEEELFEDFELQAFLDMNANSVFMAAAMALDTLATQSSSSTSEGFSLGNWSETGSTSKTDAYSAAADKLRELEYNTPAFAFGQENLSEFNALKMVRNQLLRLGL